MAPKLDPSGIVDAVKSEANLLISTFRDKGAERFAKALAIAGGLIAAAYFGVYMPPQKKIARLQREIDTAKAMSKSSGAYQLLHAELSGSYGNLPHLKDQQQWLSNAMIDSLRADNLTPESFRPVVESESSGIVFQTSTVQLSIKFSDVYFWLLRLESAVPLMHVSNIEISKRNELLGWNGVSASVMTAIPQKRYD